MSNNDDLPNKSIPTVDDRPKNARRHALLTCTAGAEIAPIEVVDSVVLGTDPAVATVVLSANDVAPRHARVWSTAAGAFLLEDLGSASGTYVNEVRVQRRTLILGDRIRLGATLVFEFTF